ncbi:acyltransferase family protein [Vibrio atypicus]|uniref:acyltransferase family protein n=1 Tax=Vibrio atypicus TaxID=558271 RepID=UPI00135CA556|nr:acyltransferase family protein [Vibrio atypicus]
MSNIKFRDDISGLRAIAVLLVILYHCGFYTISGGFVGVDVFFVLSGFLITTTIYKELESGSFSYKQFYLRRIRRLLPVLIFILLVSIVAFWFVLLPKDFIRFIDSAGLAFLSFSNFYLKNVTSGYWGANTQLVPLLHTWSLSVEEQFYLIWPTLLLFLYKIKSRQLLFIVLSSSTIGLMFYSQYLAKTDPSFAYYLLPARAFELLIGALLGIYLKDLPKLSRSSCNVLSLIGAIGILAPAFLLSAGDIFPGYYAAIVCIATACLLISGNQATQQGIINRWLSSRALVYIGLISYSLYLWHWPITVFFNYLSIEKTASIKAIILISTFVLSVFSYHCIEQVFRFKFKFDFKRSCLIFLLVPFAIFLTLVLYSRETDGVKLRFSGEENFAINLMMSRYYQDCPDLYCEPSFKQNFTSPEQADFLLIGDSHAQSMEGFFNVMANNASLKGSLVHNGGTPFLVNVERLDTKSNKFTSFSKKNLKTKQLIESFPGDTIALTARYSKYVDENYDSYVAYPGQKGISYQQSVDNFKQSFRETIDYILSMNKRLILIEDVPYFPIDRSKCELMASILGELIPCNSEEAREVINKQHAFEIDFFKQLKKEYPMVTFVDGQSLICGDKTCDARMNGVTLYKDNGHLNYVGAKLLGDKYLINHTNPLK